jgi:hypothetical protein
MTGYWMDSEPCPRASMEKRKRGKDRLDGIIRGKAGEHSARRRIAFPEQICIGKKPAGAMSRPLSGRPYPRRILQIFCLEDVIPVTFMRPKIRAKVWIRSVMESRNGH